MRTFEQVWSSLPGNGWLTKEEARLLHSSAAETTGAILEVGSYYGRSTVLLASLGRPVFAVDPFDGFDSDKSGDVVEAALRENLKTREIHNVTVFRQRIEDWDHRRFNVGFAYLDGDHTYLGTIRQVEAAVLAGASRICIHDWAKTGGGAEVKRAVEDSGLEVVRIVERMAKCRIPSQTE